MMEPTFDLRQLRQFVTLAEECHYGRAAARLNMTQPPLTQAIQRLESVLGVGLFERSQRRVALSAAGVAMLPLARKLLEAAAALPSLVRAAASGLAGHLRLAFVSSVAYGPLPAWLSGFRAAFPDVALSLREATSDVQLDLFAADEIDAAFMLHAPGAPPPAFNRLCVIDEALVMAVPQGHSRLDPDPGASGERRRWQNIADEPLVIFPRQIAPSLFDALVSAYHRGGLSMRIAQQAIQMQTIINLVSAGMGVAWVPQSVTQLQRPGVRYVRITGQPGAPLRCETSLIWQRAAPIVVAHFVEHVRANCETLGKPRLDKPLSARLRRQSPT